MSAGNMFGTLLKLSLFGESHGPAVGAVLDGFPALREINFSLIETMLQQRMPLFQHETARKETDRVEFLSGTDGKITLGSPLSFIVRNTDVRRADYENLKDFYRPGHADYVYHRKYGLLPQSGGGRASGRETAARVVAGAMALDFLRSENIDIVSYVSAIGDAAMPKCGDWTEEEKVFGADLRCPDRKTAARMQQIIDEVVRTGDSAGGVISTLVKGLPAGVGEPVFGKLNAVLSQAVMSIPGVRGIEFGDGFGGTLLRGSEYNDPMRMVDGEVVFSSNHSGGIQAGISNGNLLVMRTAFRPASSIGMKQQTVGTNGSEQEIIISGRHDACYVPRAAIVVTAMTAIAIMDLWLQYKSTDRNFRI